MYRSSPTFSHIETVKLGYCRNTERDGETQISRNREMGKLREVETQRQENSAKQKQRNGETQCSRNRETGKLREVYIY